MTVLTTVKATDNVSKTDTGGRRYAVLDAMRFVLALWVTIGHYEVFPIFAWVDATTRVGRFLTHAWSSSVFGTPAVIVFFVISGFCIHLPYRGDVKLEVGRYYLRRYTRILIPLVGAVCVYKFGGMRARFWGEHSILWESPLWSLLCEEIYYAVYPLLRRMRRVMSWERAVMAAFVMSVAVAATQRHALSWHSFGPVGTAAILLPVWLLGCLLAEQADGLPAMTTRARSIVGVGVSVSLSATLSPTGRIWMWRFAAWFASWVAEMLHFKGGVPVTQTMAWFGLLAYFWVKSEIAYSKTHAPSRMLAWAGLWSYSLYLVHAPATGIWGWLRVPNPGPYLVWCGVIGKQPVGGVFVLFGGGAAVASVRAVDWGDEGAARDRCWMVTGG
ncbi:MAG: acyltransferase [Candidatus Acidiferrum sp.]